MKCALFDTETTGIEEADRVIQAGMMVVNEDGSVEVVEDICSTTQPIPFEAMEVHGITPELLEGKPHYKDTTFKAKLDELNTEENCIIAHNIKFDIGMIKKEGFECKMKQIDTLRCARHLFPDEEHHRLQYLRYSLGLYKEEEEEAKKHNITIKAHDAIGDVLVMKLLLKKMFQKIITENTGIKKEEIVEKLCQLTVTPVLMQKINFGKYKGQTFEEIARTDRQYLFWLKNNTDADREDLVYTLDYYLKS